MKKVLIAYVPVLHNGYLKLFEDKTLNIDTLYLVGENIISDIKEMDYLKRKDSLRAVNSIQMKKAIESLGLFKQVCILDDSLINELHSGGVSVVMPNEDISYEIIDRYLSDVDVNIKSIFLRWNRNNILEKKSVEAHSVTSLSELETNMMKYAFEESKKSFDWWRQVGGLILRNGYPVLVAHNTHLPFPQSPATNGDPRSIFKRGIHFELSTAEHVEATLIAEAAKLGISTDGLDLFVTDFPCPPCAKIIARSGIKRCYFGRGYAVLDGESVLKNAGVELIFVDTQN